MTLLDESQLDALLDKLSGYAKEDERILVLARYHHLKPASLQKAATRWPKLQIDFMTIHASKGQQADYVILVGLQEGNDGFPHRRESPLWKTRFFLWLRIFRTLKSGVCYMWR